MRTNYLLLSSVTASMAVVLFTFQALSAAEQTADPMVDVVVNLLKDSDKDMRAIGLQQVREEVKGPAATKQFAELLPKLPPDTQAGLIAALTARGDKAARGAILETLKSKDEQVRLASLRALGMLGEADDVPLLLQSLASKSEAEKKAALGSLGQIRGEGTDEKIVQALKAAKETPQQIELIQILDRRKAASAVPVLLDLAISDKSELRQAAMLPLGQLASADDMPKLVQGVLKAERGAEREAAEKAVMFVCERTKDAEKRADPLLAVWEKLTDDQKIILLPTLGRVGGQKALKAVEAAIAGDNAQRRDAGVRALCNWPDSTVIPQLLKLAKDSTNAGYRLQATRALPRIAVLRDSRTDADRLDLLKQIMSLATRNEERLLVLDRAKTVRTMDCFRYVLSYMDKPEFTERVCASLVELAHDRKLHDENKTEVDGVLEKVVSICKDADVVDTAKRYLKGETVEIRKKPN
jgi:HEAT repeat protein